MPAGSPTTSPTTTWFSCNEYDDEFLLGVPESAGQCDWLADELTEAIRLCWYDNSDIIWTRKTYLASTNSGTAVPHRVVCMTLHDAPS